MCRNVQMTELQSPRHSDDHGCVNVAETALSFCQILCALFVFLLQHGRRERFGRDSAGERYIVVDVVFE